MSTSETIVPFDIQVLVTNNKFVVCRNVPTDQADPVWYVAQLKTHFSQATLDEVKDYLPEDVEGEWITREGDWWFFDWVAPGGE